MPTGVSEDTGAGVLCGLLGGVALSRLLLAACWIPAYRASRLDPLTVLRHE